MNLPTVEVAAADDEGGRLAAAEKKQKEEILLTSDDERRWQSNGAKEIGWGKAAYKEEAEWRREWNFDGVRMAVTVGD